MLTVVKFTGLRLVHPLSIILGISSVLVFSKSCGDRFIGVGDRLRMELGVPSLWPARRLLLPVPLVTSVAESVHQTSGFVATSEATPD